jgi:DNA-binding LacI/PurR family transcriptional regulator
MGEEAANAIIAAARQDIPVRSQTLATKLVMRESTKRNLR